MKATIKKPRTFAIQPASFYKFEVDCSFSCQHTFTASEVEPDPGGDETDFEPTGDALIALDLEFTDLLVEAGFAVRAFDANSESDEALHPMSLTEDVEDGYTFMVLCSFTVDFVVSGNDVEYDSDNNRSKSYVQPTEDAVAKLQVDLEETLGNNYAVSDLEASAIAQDLRKCVTLFIPRHLQLNLRRPAARKRHRPR